jgi:hypothetical protein
MLSTLWGSDAASKLTVAIGSGSVTLKNNVGTTLATVTLTDVLTTNGVVHVINTVMVPPNLFNTGAPTPAPTPNGASQQMPTLALAAFLATLLALLF